METKIKKPSIKKLEEMIWTGIQNHINAGKELVCKDWGLGIDWSRGEGKFVTSDEIGDCRCALSCLIDTKKDLALLKKMNAYSEFREFLSLKIGLTTIEIDSFTSGFDDKQNISGLDENKKYFILGQKIRTKCIEKKYLNK